MVPAVRARGENTREPGNAPIRAGGEQVGRIKERWIGIKGILCSSEA